MKNYFPFPEYREDQEATIELIDNYFSNNIDNVMVEMPTGGGKSAIAYTLASAYSDNSGSDCEENDKKQAFIITPMKILQDQYFRDFGKKSNVAILKGQNAHKCLRDPMNTCEECTHGLSNCSHKTNRTCLYLRALDKAIRSDVVICNLHSYHYLKPLMIRERELLVIDEAHTTEKFLMDLISVSIKLGNDSDYAYNNSLTITEVKDIISTELEEIQEQIDHLESLGDKLVPKQMKRLNSLIRKFDKLDHINENIDNGNWAFNLNKKNNILEYLEIKPVIVSDYFRLIKSISKKLLFLSATLQSKEIFCKSLGLKYDKTVKIDTPCRFPVDARPVYLFPTNKSKLKPFSYRNLMSDPNIIFEGINVVEKIMNHDLFKNEKGLIITNSNKFMNYITDRIKSNRFIKCSGSIEVNDSEVNDPRKYFIDNHCASDGPTILIGPNLYEGLDLKGDSCRFVIVFKCPYPMETDQIKKRRNIDNPWYNSEIMLKLIQGFGRGMRSKDDWCYTFTIDPAITNFLTSNPVPQYISDALTYTPKSFY